jgi:ABC-type antimicrobial peptide transport system permease subunit
LSSHHLRSVCAVDGHRIRHTLTWQRGSPLLAGASLRFDELGRDILSRVICGSHLHAGGKLRGGGVAGDWPDYRLNRWLLRSRIDRFVNVIVMNAFLSFPGILIAIAFVAFRD